MKTTLPAPHKVRLPSRQTLLNANFRLSHKGIWHLEIAGVDPVSFRVVGDPVFEGTCKPAPGFYFSEIARVSVTAAIRDLAEHPDRPLLRFIVPGQRLSGGWLSKPDIILGIYRRFIIGEIDRTIEGGGFEALRDLPSGQRFKRDTVETSPLSARPTGDGGEMDKLLEEVGIVWEPTTSSAPVDIDPLRIDWEAMPIPNDILLKKAVKYVFGQSWALGLRPADLGGLFVESCARFRVYAFGAQLENEGDCARTAAFRAVQLLVKGDPLELSSRLPGLSGKWPTDPGEQQECLPALREHLCAEMVRAVDNHGYVGLLKFSAAKEGHPPR